MNSNIYKGKIKFPFLIITILLIWYLGRFLHIDTKDIEGFLKALPIFYSSVLFIILYCFVTFFIWLSKDVFRFVGAILFGAILSTLFIWIAEIINAFILFNFSRYLGRSFVENSLKGKYNKLDERLGKVSFTWLLLFRAVPLIPFRFLDLGVGLTSISLRKYIIAVLIGSPLRIFWLQYILVGVGKSIFNNPYAFTEYLMQNRPIFLFSLVYLLLVILVAVKIKKRF